VKSAVERAELALARRQRELEETKAAELAATSQVDKTMLRTDVQEAEGRVWDAETRLKREQRRISIPSQGETFRHYMTVISEGPLMIVRAPYVRRLRRDGEVSIRSAMPWRDLLKALTFVMRSHGLRLKDVYAVEGMGPAAETPEFEARWEVERARLDVAFCGGLTILPNFWLYEWKDGAFVLVRDPTGANATKRSIP
jgi:hypothetical protein